MALALISVKIAVNSCHCGIDLTKLKLPDKCFVIGIARGNQIILASENPSIWYEDYILAVTLNSALVPMLKNILNKTHPIHYFSQKYLIKK
ncbi:MAG: TrkA C-terminal domain-containing protein [Goleter apudmare HA4340-LM2]|jgi:Trk K+ transport system NAD-binding subunit|nr:TrkA C-terminal domain-containing protein [Goleter apudmare HA4340-LM2]